MASAKQAHDKGDYKSAIIHLKNVLQKTPKDAEARYLLGLSYNEAGDPWSAEKEFRLAIELQKDAAAVRPQLAKALLLQGNFEAVLKETEPDEEGTPLSPALLSARGVAQLSLGSIDDAKASFEKALTGEPDFPDALLGQARVAAATHDIARAEKLVELALKKSPLHLDGLLVKGDLLRLVNNNEAALAAYQKVTEHYPDNVTARLNVATIFLDLGKYEQVMQQVEVVRKIAPQSPMANYLQGLVEFKKKDYVKAKASVDEVLKSMPTHLPSRLLGGSVEYALGNYSESEQHLKYLLKSVPRNVYARKLLAVNLLRSRQAPQAVDVLLPALEQAPEDLSLLALAAEAFLQNNEFARAAIYYEKAAKIDPKNTQMRTGLGLSRLAAGDSDRALADLETAIGLEGENSRADVLQVMMQISRRDFDKAELALQSLEKKQPNNPLTHNLKGAILIGKKKYPAARVALEKALQLSPTFFPASMNLAQLDLQDGNPKAARQRFEMLLQKQANNLQALLALASLSNRLGASSDELVGWLTRAQKENPGSLQPTLMLARHYLNASDAKKAVQFAREAQVVSPDNVEVLDILGSAQLASGENNAAITTFSRLVALQPKSTTALIKLAHAQMANDNAPSAAFSLKKALALKPGLLEAQSPLAMIEARAGRFTEALRIVGQVQSKTPTSPVGIVLEGDVRMIEKQYLQAAALYEKALAMEKRGSSAIKLYGALRAGGKPDEAEVKLLGWIKQNPDDMGARLYLADVSLKTNKRKIAAEQYEWVIKRQPNNLLALNNVAWAYHQGNDARALSAAEQAYALSATNPLIMDTYGWMLVHYGNLEKGTELLQRASSLVPDQPEIRYHYAVALLKSGKDQAARTELEHALTSRQKFTQQTEARELLEKLTGTM
ncbi:MAG: PEP-CTERM system TPR-repeat protein PrsT [Burkholderiales bacterium]|nr:PEP-CTERM system TPR-repeat protein PrsT [Burkholderiales bacterium]